MLKVGSGRVGKSKPQQGRSGEMNVLPLKATLIIQALKQAHQRARISALASATRQFTCVSTPDAFDLSQ